MILVQCEPSHDCVTFSVCSCVTFDNGPSGRAVRTKIEFLVAENFKPVRGIHRRLLSVYGHGTLDFSSTVQSHSFRPESVWTASDGDSRGLRT